MTTHEPGDESQSGPAQPPPAPQQAVTSPVNRMLVLGVLVGLVVGAGGVGLAWGLSGSSGAAADADAVCGIILRTPDLPEKPDDITLEYTQRWAVSEVAESIAKGDATYRPLADALGDVLTSLRNFRTDDMRTAMGRARQICEDL